MLTRLKFQFILIICSFTFTAMTAQQSSSVYETEDKECPGLDILGFGYDVFGEYANMKSKSRYPILKFGGEKRIPIGSSTYRVPEKVFLDNMSEHITKTVEGSSLRDYAKELAVQAGIEIDAKVFSASIDAQYGSISTSSEERYYFTYMDANTKWRISVDERIDLRTMLDEKAKKDIDTMDPDKLFELYGTYVITSAYLGGRAEYTSNSIVTSSYTKEDIRVAVEAKYKFVSGNAEFSTKDEETLKESKTETNLFVAGGNSEYANDIENYKKYILWANGIKDYPVLCEFEKNGLKPIWEFAEKGSSRQKELEKAFYALAGKYPLPPELELTVDNLGKTIYEQSSSGNGDCWSGWKNVKFVKLNGEQFIFRNGRNTHENEYAHFIQIPQVIPTDGSLVISDKWNKDTWNVWGPGWTMIDWYQYEDKTYHIALNGNGDVAFDKYEFAKNRQILKTKWSPGWSSLITFHENDKAFYFVYKKNEGRVSIRGLNPKPIPGELYSGSPIQKGNKEFHHFKKDNRDFLFALSSKSATLYEIINTGSSFNLEQKWSVQEDWAANINHSLIIDNFGDPILFLYNGATGQYSLHRFDNKVKIQENFNAVTNFGKESLAAFDSFEMNGKSYLMSFKHNYFRINEMNIPERPADNQSYKNTNKSQQSEELHEEIDLNDVLNKLFKKKKKVE